MDVRLHNAWRARTAPFDAESLVVEQLTVTELRAAVRLCERSMFHNYRNENLLTQLDFHDRDGYLRPLEEISWSEFDNALREERAAIAWAGDRTGEHRLFTTESREAVLRWAVDFSQLPIVVQFDFAGPSDAVSMLYYPLERLLGDERVLRLPAKKHFDRRWRVALTQD